MGVSVRVLGRLRGCELLSCPYPLKVQACPTMRPKTRYPVSGLGAGQPGVHLVGLLMVSFIPLCPH